MGVSITCLHGSAWQVVIGDLRFLWESQNDPLTAQKPLDQLESIFLWAIWGRKLGYIPNMMIIGFQR